MCASLSLQPPAAGIAGGQGRVGQSMECVLRAARAHLGMDVAFISEFRDDHTRLLRHVAGESPRMPLRAGDVLPLAGSYCAHVVDGRLPALIPDTAALPVARAHPATRALAVGAHAGVPIRLRDGRLFGALCCFRQAPHPALGERELGLLHTFAELVAQQLEAEAAPPGVPDARAARLAAVLAAGQPDMVFQPIFKRGPAWTLCGVECLARFAAEPRRSPDQWFAEAWDCGMGVALELAAIRRGLAALATLPGDFYVAVNCSPETAMSGELEAALDALPPARLVLEITEHAVVDDYDALVRSLQGLRARGVRVAIDDAGAGYASLHHILRLHPDVIKLDLSLIRDIDRDPARRALAQALVAFADHTGSTILAEGVETEAELAVLATLGVTRVQGYGLSKPLSREALATLLAGTDGAVSSAGCLRHGAR